MVEIQCPQTVDNFFDFNCKVVMLLPPRPGFKSHNVSVTIGFAQPLNYNLTFNTSDYTIAAKAGYQGTFNVTASERNYNMTYTARITVNQSNIFISIFHHL